MIRFPTFEWILAKSKGFIFEMADLHTGKSISGEIYKLNSLRNYDEKPSQQFAEDLARFKVISI